MRVIIAIVLSAAALAACTPESNNDVTGSIDNCARKLYSAVQSQGQETVRRGVHRLRARRDHDLLDRLHAEGRAVIAGKKSRASLRHVIERHRPQPQRQIRLAMQRGDHLAHRQPRHVGERVRETGRAPRGRSMLPSA